jgi:hypothetical protein
VTFDCLQHENFHATTKQQQQAPTKRGCCNGSRTCAPFPLTF